jgi:hypothetical protein
MPEITTRSQPKINTKTGEVDIVMRVSPIPARGRLAYAAPPPPDRRFSFTGSGLPFANAQEALASNRASRGVANVDVDGTFVAKLAAMPGSYYAGLGTKLIPPCVHVTYMDTDGKRVRLVGLIGVESIPHRTLTHPASRTGPQFYNATEKEVRAQDTILKESAWSRIAHAWATTTTGFWINNMNSGSTKMPTRSRDGWPLPLTPPQPRTMRTRVV